MKNVKTLLIILLGVGMMWASDARISALGGNAGFWADDDQNYTLFPQAINNLDMVQVSGAGNGTGSVGVVWGEGTTWGFMYDGAGDDAGNDWLNILWGNGNMGVNVSVARSAMDSGVEGDNASSTMDLGVAWGQNMGFGELGVSFANSSVDDGDSETDDPASMGLSANVRRTQALWLFSDMLIGFNYGSATQGDASITGISLGVDCYTSLPMADGVRGVFAMGFGYWSNSDDSGLDGEDAVEQSAITLPKTTIGVEADVTDWATVRFGMTNSYTLAGSNGDATSTGRDDFDWNFGLGFDYGSFQLDMVINEDIFNNPMHYVTGRNESDLTNSGATLTYNF